MTDPLDSVEEPNAAEMSALQGLLAHADVWDDPPDELEQRVVAAISVEAVGETTGGRGGAGDSSDEVRPASLDETRDRRPDRAMPWWLAAAAAVAVVVAGVAIIGRDADEPSRGVEIAMRGTESAPNASATVALSSTPAGLKILLDAEGLPGAPPGYFYEAWVSDGTTLVSAGTFHLRGGHGEIELWAGVVDPSFTRLSVTLEPLDADTGSSGDLKLVGEYDLGRD